MSKETSLMLKGVAIFMMLFLHLFNSPNLLDSCHPLFFIGDVPIVSILTRVCKPVEFFLMHNQSLRIKGNRGKRKECNYLEYHHLAFSYYFEAKQERALNGRSSVTKS
ncbi:hypothetical protein [Prevotella intermedia]|uniref:hypothetical protein n=1 Tax=Prevotella intermedia TaxID=28131 RepID=UPI0012FDA81D|nr:hypothetical protein [Prevotella intermedia]